MTPPSPASSMTWSRARSTASTRFHLCDCYGFCSSQHALRSSSVYSVRTTAMSTEPLAHHKTIQIVWGNVRRSVWERTEAVGVIKAARLLYFLQLHRLRIPVIVTQSYAVNSSQKSRISEPDISCSEYIGPNSGMIFWPYKAQWFLYVPPALTYRSFTFFPQSAFMCSVLISG